MRIIGVVKERDTSETRVALVPDVVREITRRLHVQVYIEAGAGDKAGFIDDDYRAVDAIIVEREELFQQANTLIAVNGREFFEHIDMLRNKLLIALFEPFTHVDAMKKFNEACVSVLALEMIPRISRAQAMDVLSSQANIAGYAAVILAASKLSKVIPLMMTAAGTIKPAKFLILGAGVAGLQAIATAKRLGAVVFAYDVRAVVKEQVESLGGKFVEIQINENAEGQGGYAKALSHAGEEEQRRQLAHIAKDVDVIISTAQIPGRSAPLLLDDTLFSLLNHEVVMIDMAAASGGNIAGSVLGNWVTRGKALLYGAGPLATTLAKDASFTLSKNLKALLENMNQNAILLDDEIIKDALICHNGEWSNAAFKKIVAP